MRGPHYAECTVVDRHLSEKGRTAASAGKGEISLSREPEPDSEMSAKLQPSVYLIYSTGKAKLNAAEPPL